MIHICWNDRGLHEIQVTLPLTQSAQESLTNAPIRVDLEPTSTQGCGRWGMNHRIKQVLHACLDYLHATFHRGSTHSGVSQFRCSWSVSPEISTPPFSFFNQSVFLLNIFPFFYTLLLPVCVSLSGLNDASFLMPPLASTFPFPLFCTNLCPLKISHQVTQ